MNELKYITVVDFEQLQNDADLNTAGMSIGDIVSDVVALFFPIAGFVLMGYLIYSGYRYMTSAGDPKITAQAQQSITYAVVGFVLITVSFLIAQYFGLVLSIEQMATLFGG